MFNFTQRVTDRYTSMSPEERAEERAWQREMMNTSRDGEVVNRAAARLDIMDVIDGR